MRQFAPPTFPDALAELLGRAGIDQALVARLRDTVPLQFGQFDRDAEAHGPHWSVLDAVQRRLGGPTVGGPDVAVVIPALRGYAADSRAAFLDMHAEELYRRLTNGYRRFVRVETLVDDAARAVPGLAPTESDIAAERGLRLGEKPGLELYQGILVSKIAALPGPGHHLCHAMLLPREGSDEALARFRRDGSLDLGVATVERRDPAAVVTLRTPARLNAEDNHTSGPLETAADVVLMDPEIGIGVLRGGTVDQPKYARRRVFGSGINLTGLYWGEIPYLFYIVRDMGFVNKLVRGLARPDRDPSEIEGGTSEKPWIAVVEGFAIGGACQLLLAVDHVIAEREAYLTLPARKEGIIPGLANLRLPRAVGDRLARQAIMNDRRIDCDSPEGRLICDEIVPADGIETAIDRAVAGFAGSGMVSAEANRRAIRIGAEPLDLFRQYMAVYAREQAFCHLSPALVANLERHWDARNRRAD